MPVTGRPPAYKAVLPDNFRSYTVAFPTWQAYSDAAHKIWDAEIGYIAHRQFNFLGRDLKWAMVKILTDPNGTLTDLENLMKDKKILKTNETMKRDFQLILAGMTPRDIAWQEKALDQILEEVGGWKVEALLDPDIKDWSMVYMLRLGHKNLNLVYGGGYDGAFGLPGSPDFGIQFIEEMTEFKKEWEKKGNIVAAGGDCTMGGIGVMGGGGATIWENFAHFDPASKKSTEGCLAFFDATAKLGIEKGWGPPMEKQNDTARWTDGYATPKEIRNKLLNGSAQPSAFWYQRKVKELFDPNDLGDYYYRALEK